MEYHLKINDDTVTVTADQNPDKTVFVKIEDRAYHVTGTRLHDHHLHLSVNGRGENVFVSQNGSGKDIMVKGCCSMVEDRDHPSVSNGSRKKSAKIPDTVTPPMPSVVVAVLVSENDTVAKGQGLVVVSAMKMETTLSSPFDGTVKAIRTSVGDKVNPGDILVDIEALIS